MKMPESVTTYLTDGGSRRAITGLRNLGGAGVLDGLEWSELPRFYRAMQATRQFETDWAIAACSLWELVWGGLLVGWQPLSPDEQVQGAYDAGLAIDELLETGDGSLWFGRVFTYRGWTLGATISAVPAAGIVVKATCETDTRSTRFLSLCASADAIGCWSSRPVEIDNGVVDTAALRAIAAAAAAELPGNRRGGMPTEDVTA
jgi:hypothetical protein